MRALHGVQPKHQLVVETLKFAVNGPQTSRRLLSSNCVLVNSGHGHGPPRLIDNLWRASLRPSSPLAFEVRRLMTVRLVGRPRGPMVTSTSRKSARVQQGSQQRLQRILCTSPAQSAQLEPRQSPVASSVVWRRRGATTPVPSLQHRWTHSWLFEPLATSNKHDHGANKSSSE